MKLKLQKKISLIVLLTLAISSTTFAYGCEDCGAGQFCDCTCSCRGPGGWSYENTNNDSHATNSTDFWFDDYSTGESSASSTVGYVSYSAASCGHGKISRSGASASKTIFSTASTTFSFSSNQFWDGSGPACSRYLRKSDGGGEGSEKVAIACTTANGNSAELHTSGSSWEGSIPLGTGYAHTMQSLSLTVDANGTATTFVGNLDQGEQERVDNSSTYIDGWYDPNDTITDNDPCTPWRYGWGHAKYTYSDTDEYRNDCTNITYVYSRSGATAVTAEASSQNPGYIEYWVWSHAAR